MTSDSEPGSPERTPAWAEALGPSLAGALAKKGYTELTAVQQAMLEPGIAGRDLRITSQTGSGKTLAIGIALRDLAGEPRKGEAALAKPFALVLAPTRELALQVKAELRWLYANEKGGVAAVTGGASYRDERRALSAGPALIVGTPGRLLDHLERGAIDLSEVGAVVLDEADRMLELGFREDIENILAKTPKQRRTHLVSATFPRGVQTLANAVQTNPAHVQGTQLGVANADIDHIIHLVDPRQKLDAIVNLLLMHPDDQTLVFARTRADVADLAGELSRAGFAVAAFSGEMDQTARNRTLAAFKRGDLKMLIATDVAARGIDVQDITRVVHVEMPTNADSYTHRSGRTGRAGRKGVSAILITPVALVPTTRILRGAGIQARIEPIPTKAHVQRAIEDRVIAELTGEPSEAEVTAEDPRLSQLAERLANAGDPVRALTRLLGRSRYASLGEARDVRAILPPPERRGREDRAPARGRGQYDEHRSSARDPRGPRGRVQEQAPRDSARPTGPRARSEAQGGGYATFRVSWGSEHGADPRRVLALVCRRGDVPGRAIGAIRIERNFALVEVAGPVAEGFERAAAEPDPRDPRVTIRRDAGAGRAAGAPPARSAPRAPRTPAASGRGADKANAARAGTRPPQRKR